MDDELRRITDALKAKYRELNKSVKFGEILFTGSSLMEQFPIEKFMDEMGNPYTIYNRGIGGYRIDMAVVKDGRYVLGIECDGKLYHSSASARDRDYHRQKYLESRGWRIHRIWSSNWWNNPSAEIDKICNILESA